MPLRHADGGLCFKKNRPWGRYPIAGWRADFIMSDAFLREGLTFMVMKTLKSSPQEKTVKRVLRHRASHEYFKDGGWTTNPEDANSFSDIVEIAETCSRYGLKDVELAVRFEAAECDVFCTTIR